MATHRPGRFRGTHEHHRRWQRRTRSHELGTIPGAVFKGGWGPEPENGYVVRQFGLMPGPKPYGIAVMVVADNYQSGQYALSLAAKYLQA